MSLVTCHFRLQRKFQPKIWSDMAINHSLQSILQKNNRPVRARTSDK